MTRRSRTARSATCMTLLLGALASLHPSRGMAQWKEPVADDEWVATEAEIPPLRVISFGVSRLDVLGAEDANYLGLSAERVGDRFGFSGSLLIGGGSDGGTWVHLPIAGPIFGLVVAVPFALLDDLLGTSDPDDDFDYEDEDDSLVPSFVFEALMYENVHRHVWLNDRVLLSPYVAVLGLDGQEGDAVDGFMSLSSGIGLGARLFATERIVVAPDFAFRHHWVLRSPTSREPSRWGYTVGLRGGWAF